MSFSNRAGQTLGRYELRQLLGRGGMGEVYRAYDTQLGREVAIKVILLGAAPDALERFNREALTVAALEHRHIVHIYEFGTWQDVTFISMRLLTGGSLEDRLNAGQALPSLREIADILKQLASALDYAHSQGVIHRDIKAGNVLFDNQGHVYLADFGLAKVLGRASNLSGSGAFIGTFTHMPPEQWRGEELTPAADQYSLAVMTYQMVTGRLPFDGPVHILMDKHLHDTPTPPYALRMDVPETVKLVLDRAMAKEPGERFPTVTAFVQAFDGAVPGSKSENTGFLFESSTKISRQIPLPTPPPMPRPTRRNPLLWVAGVVGLGLLTLLVFLNARPPTDGANAALAASETAQVAAPLPSNTPVPTFTDMPTATPLPSETPPPSETPTPVPTPSETPTATDMPTLTPTLPPEAAAQATRNYFLTLTAATLPTPDEGATIVAQLTQLFWQDVTLTAEAGYTGTVESLILTQQAETLTAASWTDTPTPTPTAIPTNTTVPPTIPTPIPTQTPLPPASTEIVFRSRRDGNWELYRLDMATGEMTRLTVNDTADWTPAWSPDGQRIAYISQPSGRGEIFIMDADGNNAQRITTSSGTDWSPVWSPNGERIAFASDRDGDWEIYTVRADGSDLQPLTVNDTSDYTPTWSPDGQRIAFRSERDGNREIYMMNADGGNPQRLTDSSADDGFPAWSPDGNWIAFMSDRAGGNQDIYVMDAQGVNVRRLTEHAAEDWYPAWSPDGRQIAFASDRDGNYEIYVMNADGSDQRRVTDHSADDLTPAWRPGNVPQPVVSSPVEFTVQATQGRYETTLQVNAGQTITVEYVSGNWQAGPSPTWPMVGVAGDAQVPGKESFPAPDAPVMTLLAGIGNTVWPAGQGLTMVAPESGVLWLGANDDNFGDNAGSITVRISIGENAPPISTAAQTAAWTPVLQSFGAVEMALAPPGCFTMGSSEEQIDAAYAMCEANLGTGQCQRTWFEKEGPPTNVCFSEPFWISRTEVTNGQYGSSGRFPGENRPRVDVNWAEAAAFCAGQGGRLPTEAEWEYAARGPDNLLYPWGNTFLPENAIYANGATNETATVGSRPGGVSWVGALDMSGNAREWTSTIFQPYPYNGLDGRENPADSASARVIRGGSWLVIPVSLRTADRVGDVLPGVQDWGIGFRCVRDYQPEDRAAIPTTLPTPITTNGAWTPRTQTINGAAMALVPAGCFTMGMDNAEVNEQPAHQQCFNAPFWIDRYEVTNAQYGAAGGYSAPDQPRETVTWFEAAAFCASRGARLPTEAEWEYAARGPDGLVYPWGDQYDEGYGIFRGTQTLSTAPVGSRQLGVSWVGALDMSGNVWEWTSTIFRPYPYDAGDGREDPADTASSRVLRGGSWDFGNVNVVRASYRGGDGFLPSGSDDGIGFRCVLDEGGEHSTGVIVPTSPAVVAPPWRDFPLYLVNYRGLTIWLRTEPNSASYSEHMPGMVAELASDIPREANGQRWWQVRVPGGRVGWVEEQQISDREPVTVCSADLPLIGYEGARIIVAEGDDALRVRSFPGSDGEVVTRITRGQAMTIGDGPVCSDGFTWWRVDEGWIAEGDENSYYIELTEGSVDPFRLLAYEDYEAPDIVNTLMAEQSFEGGRMLWLQAIGDIWVVLNNSQWMAYDDTFAEGEPENDPSLQPPGGFQQPVRGFGKVWREHEETRAGLGWAVESEVGYQGRYIFFPEDGHYLVYDRNGNELRFDDNGRWRE